MEERFWNNRIASVYCTNFRKLCTATHEERKTIHPEDADRTGEDNEKLFNEIKQRFLYFKKNKFLKEAENYQALAKLQSPKFMVIACVDSRVCPSNILGFEPGEAFTVRNVANLVPHSEFGPSETSAALEFAVRSLEVKNVLVIGHSSCAGIEALMSMKDTESRSYIDKWVTKGQAAKLRTKSSAAHLDFYQQCKHCEKESVNESLKNLLTYPWIKERVGKGELTLHGSYYDFANCTFEKWTLHIEGEEISVKDHTFWC
ncbi:hypothetical protein SAY87_024471 [Trapa incisa]|uniref:Carbonic anhydrase n=1 Tax=Trapa incisa TaxID=236973 RepID=A0AAN7GJX9_9MYRT|nr:hypothetical protein SAY87_024471 [Trapa incisa]